MCLNIGKQLFNHETTIYSTTNNYDSQTLEINYSISWICTHFHVSQTIKINYSMSWICSSIYGIFVMWFSRYIKVSSFGYRSLGVGILLIRDLSDSRNGFDRGLLFEVLLAMFNIVHLLILIIIRNFNWSLHLLWT